MADTFTNGVIQLGFGRVLKWSFIPTFICNQIWDIAEFFFAVELSILFLSYLGDEQGLATLILIGKEKKNKNERGKWVET